MTYRDQHGTREFCPLTWTVRVVPVPRTADEAALYDLERPISPPARKRG